jgi:hypothetical protein
MPSDRFKILYAKPTKSETLHNDLSVITNVLATFKVKSRPWAKEQSFVPVQRLYVNCDNWEYELRYNIFFKTGTCNTYFTG